MILALPACRNLVSPQQHQPVTKNTELPTSALPPSHQQFQTDIPLLTEAHLQLEYWLDKTSAAEQRLLNPIDIERFNQHLIQTLPEVTDLFVAPDVYHATQIQKFILKVSHPSTNPRYFRSGVQLDRQHWLKLEQSLALSQIAAQVPLQFALVTRRGKLRSFPTAEPVYSHPAEQNLDRFQETAVFPGEALQVLHISLDQQWAFVRNYHYSGWLAREHIAMAPKSVVQQFANSSDFILVTGASASTNVSPELPAASAVQLDMGVKLPRVRHHDAVINGQNASFSYVVLLPIRQPNGQLQLVHALISRNQDLAQQYLPLTQANILRQSFKFLGERYGWGHDLNGRDCSGFIVQIYRSFGFILPRNTSSQGQAGFGAELRLTAASTTRQQRLVALKQAQAGDLIFIPGHVMLVLGQENGEIFVIHDVAGLRYYRADGSFYHSVLNGVSITPLSPLQKNPQHSYIDGIYMLKSIGRQLYDPQAD